MVTRGHGRLAKHRVQLNHLPPDVALIVNDLPSNNAAATGGGGESNAAGGDSKWMKDETDFDTYQAISEKEEKDLLRLMSQVRPPTQLCSVYF